MKKYLIAVFSCALCGCIQFYNTYTHYNWETNGYRERKNISIGFCGYLFEQRLVSYGNSRTEFYEKRYSWENDTAKTAYYSESAMVGHPWANAIRDYFERIGYNVKSQSPDFIITVFPQYGVSSDGMGYRFLAYICTLGFWQMGAGDICFRVKVNDKFGNLIYDDVSAFHGETSAISLIPIIPIGLIAYWDSDILSWQIKAIENALDSLNVRACPANP